MLAQQCIVVEYASNNDILYALDLGAVILFLAVVFGAFGLVCLGCLLSPHATEVRKASVERRPLVHT